MAEYRMHDHEMVGLRGAEYGHIFQRTDSLFSRLTIAHILSLVYPLSMV
jgi:hypothetical protein